MCTIVADTSNIESSARSGKDGDYFVQLFDVVLGCGKTEWNAYLRWKHEVCSIFQNCATSFRSDKTILLVSRIWRSCTYLFIGMNSY